MMEEETSETVAFNRARGKAKKLAYRYKRMRPLPGIAPEDIEQECMLCWVTGRTMEYGIIDLYRKNVGAQRAEMYGIDMDTMPAETDDLEAFDGMEREEIISKLRVVVDTIPDERVRYVIDAHFFSGLTFDEIALIMDCPRSTAHFLKNKGLEFIKAECSKLMGG